PRGARARRHALRPRLDAGSELLNARRLRFRGSRRRAWQEGPREEEEARVPGRARRALREHEAGRERGPGGPLRPLRQRHGRDRGPAPAALREVPPRARGGHARGVHGRARGLRRRPEGARAVDQGLDRGEGKRGPGSRPARRSALKDERAPPCCVEGRPRTTFANSRERERSLPGEGERGERYEETRRGEGTVRVDRLNWVPAAGVTRDARRANGNEGSERGATRPGRSPMELRRRRRTVRSRS